MAKSDYYPVTDVDKLLFLDNLVTAVGSVGATVGLLAADITAIGTARTDIRSQKPGVRSLADSIARTHDSSVQ